MDTKIFKAYDIRGIFPDELDEETAYKIGRAFVLFVNKNRIHSFELLKNENPKIVVGMDNRFSSVALCNELKRGITDQGGDVVDIGLSTTPMLYFATAKYGYDAGVNITASHNPSQYNGFKLVSKGAVPISGDTGIENIKNLVIKNSFPDVKKKGSIEKKHILSNYVESIIPDEDFYSTIIVDTANSVSGIPINGMLKRTRLIHIFDNLDSGFPNHEPDPIKSENICALRKAVVAGAADLGVAFDGDGDRMVFVDERGHAISSDLIVALMASIILKKQIRQKILCDIRCSNIVSETIKKWGGIPVISRVGHSFIKQIMRKENVLFGGEFSGHYYYKKDYFCESPFFVLFSILREMKKTEKTLSDLMDPFKKYYHSEEINFKITDSQQKIKEIKEKYKDGIINELDGLRIDFPEWWLLIRASNTEPILRLIIEAQTKFLMEEKIKEVSSFIQQ
ncbi:MAG: phosphomannomutase/phosphoglucomutase [Candidatus Paceibacterota bacterium]|jgi:phosphomannomutase